MLVKCIGKPYTLGNGLIYCNTGLVLINRISFHLCTSYEVLFLRTAVIFESYTSFHQKKVMLKVRYTDVHCNHYLIRDFCQEYKAIYISPSYIRGCHFLITLIMPDQYVILTSTKQYMHPNFCFRQ